MVDSRLNSPGPEGPREMTSPIQLLPNILHLHNTEAPVRHHSGEDE